ncbi:hypothetical protein DFJ73DRAFT_199151 [Zopfochytrium polystomum]|nr:hypothetical protein DFJ73DRAFT_199151 [Zopfochytrium polystomum]
MLEPPRTVRRGPRLVDPKESQEGSFESDGATAISTIHERALLGEYAAGPTRAQLPLESDGIISTIEEFRFTMNLDALRSKDNRLVKENNISSATDGRVEDLFSHIITIKRESGRRSSLTGIVPGSLLRNMNARCPSNSLMSITKKLSQCRLQDELFPSIEEKLELTRELIGSIDDDKVARRTSLRGSHRRKNSSSDAGNNLDDAAKQTTKVVAESSEPPTNPSSENDQPSPEHHDDLGHEDNSSGSVSAHSSWDEDLNHHNVAARDHSRSRLGHADLECKTPDDGGYSSGHDLAPGLEKRKLASERAPGLSAPGFVGLLKTMNSQFHKTGPGRPKSAPHSSSKPLSIIISAIRQEPELDDGADVNTSISEDEDEQQAPSYQRHPPAKKDFSLHRLFHTSEVDSSYMRRHHFRAGLSPNSSQSTGNAQTTSTTTGQQNDVGISMMEA